MIEGMSAAHIAAASGFTRKEISDLAARGLISSTGGGGKGRLLSFNSKTLRLCTIARKLMCGLGIPVGDAFRLSAEIDSGQKIFGEIALRIDG